jgi:ribonuclease HI
MNATVFTDGGARPTNPGHAGIGIFIEFDDRKEVLSRYLGIKTNNEAEYIALYVAAGYAYYLGAREIEFRCDSALVVNQVLGEWFPKDFRMRSYCYDVRDRLNKYYPDAWSLLLIPRAQNSEADQLCTDAIHWGMNRNPFTRKAVKNKKPRPAGKVIDPFQVGHALVPQ